MFKLNDLVMINLNNEERKSASPGCPALNLEGSICRIKNISSFQNRNRYALEMVSLCAKDPNQYEQSDMHLAWRDSHLVLFTEDNFYFEKLEVQV